MNPDEIRRKAEKERHKLEKKALEKANVKQKKTRGPVSADSFYVYAKIYPSRYKPMLWFFAGLTGIVFLILWLLNEFGLWALYTGVALLSIFIFRVLLQQVFKLSSYHSYKNFRATLPFAVEGWEKLGAHPNFFMAQHWAYNCSVEVMLKNGASEKEIKLMNDALLIFITDANKCFYKSWMMDGRTEWHFIHVLKVDGSANTEVVGNMYTLLHVLLRGIYKQYPIIEKVNIRFGDEIGLVESPPVTD